MIVRSRAPLRLGLAGGGTDVSPYCDNFGGCVLNATINMYAYCTVIPRTDGKVVFKSDDLGQSFEGKAEVRFDTTDKKLVLHKGVYNRIIKDFNGGKPLSLEVHTYADAPAGSGLGTSSTVVVAILKAYVEWLKLPLGEYDIARLAYEIERVDLKLAGGKQDQYAATFGGFNFIEFYDGDKVIVNPLRVKKWILSELESSLVLYFTGVSRDSAAIIEKQVESATKKDSSMEAMHRIKEVAYVMKEAVLTGKFDLFEQCLREGWEAKKRSSDIISNPHIERCYDFVMSNGGRAAKVSGAGGGGFMMIFCDPKDRFTLINALKRFDSAGKTYTVNFDLDGSRGWIV